MSTETPIPSVVRLTIDGMEVIVPKGTTVFHAAKQLGIEIPIFCYQDRMPPFGACRMCLVEVEKMPKLQTSCTLEATEGMVVKTQSSMAVEGREGILEFLLINHPLDCPICDRGGECPLQENAIKFGPGKSRFYEEKRHFKKALPLGPVLMLDRERCIICARCTRFGELVAGDNALEFIDRGFRTEVGTPDGGPAQSKYIGNTIMICPVGALTSDVYRFRARPWDNEPTNSTCTLCPVGCSMILDSRDGEIMRTRSDENPEVNDIWLCDKGWFGYEFTAHPNRLLKPLIRRGGHLEPASWDEALSLIAEKIQEAKPQGKLGALGGSPLTIEENYLFQALLRQGAGVNHVDYRVGMPIFSLDEEGKAPGMEMTIGDCERLSFAVLLGIDITEEFPVIWLRLKQAINHGATVIFLGHFAPEISPHLKETLLHSPGQELEILKKHFPQIAELAKKGGKGAIFVGRQYLSMPNRKAIISELTAFQKSTTNVALNLLEGHGNSMGARLAGMHPELGPMGKRLEKPGLNALEMLQTTAEKGWDFLYVAGANPAMKDKNWEKARSNLKFLVVQDLFLTETARQADVVLPTLSFIEKVGHFVNIEGRWQQLLPGKQLPDVFSDGEIFKLIGKKIGIVLKIQELKGKELGSNDQNEDQGLKNLDPVINDEKNESHSTTVGTEGSKDSQEPQVKGDELGIKRKETVILSQESTGRQKSGLMATFAMALFDRGVRMKHNPHVSKLAKPPYVRLHPREGERLKIEDEHVVKLTANGNEILAKVKLDGSVAEKTIVLPLGFDQVPVYQLNSHLINGFEVEIENQP